MTHLADRPQHTRHHEHARHHSNERRDRAAGVRILDRVDVGRPTGNRSGERQLTDQLRAGARGAALAQLNDVRAQNEFEGGAKLPLNADTVHLAHISQIDRLANEQITDDMTRSQLTNELMAQAILAAPEVSDALKTRRRRESREILSRYNDVLAAIVESLPSKLTPGYKTAIVDALKLESLALNQQIGHSSEISGKDHESGLDELRTIMNGVTYEIAPKNALRGDPNLEVITPQDTASDLKGIDMIVKRKSDGKMMLVDMKTRGSYLSTVAEYQGRTWVDERAAGSYYFTKMQYMDDGEEYPHYLLNSNSFGQIPAEGFDYTPAGQEKVRRIVHEMLDQ